MFRLVVRSERSWRPLLGLLVAYAVAIQSLLVAIGGIAPSAPGLTTFELCSHDGQGGSELPTSYPSHHSGWAHCILCVAGSDHAVTGAPPAVYHRAFVTGVDVLLVSINERLPHLLAHTIANPRGPPLGE
jgi:hypothetical protein